MKIKEAVKCVPVILGYFLLTEFGKMIEFWIFMAHQTESDLYEQQWSWITMPETHWARAPSRPKLRSAVAPSGLSSSTGCPVSHSSLPVALLASHPPCGSLWAAPKAPLGPRFPSGQFAALTRREKALYCPFLKEGVRNVARNIVG